MHKLVTLLYVEGDRSLTVNHKNGCKNDISYNNLEWITQRENLIHAYNTGLNPVGEGKPNAILTNEQVHCICKYLQNGYNYDDIIKLMNFEDNKSIRRVLADIKRGKSWKRISCNYNMPTGKIPPTRILTNEQVHQICTILENNINESIKNILDKIDIKIYSNEEYERYRHLIQSIKFKDAYMDISNEYIW